MELTNILDESRTSLTMRSFDKWLDHKEQEADALKPAMDYGHTNDLLFKALGLKNKMV